MFRAKGQKKLRLSNGVSCSQFLSVALVCSVSGQKIKSFVIAEMYFVQRVLPCRGTGREMKAESREGKTKQEGRRKRRHRKKSRMKDNEE